MFRKIREKFINAPRIHKILIITTAVILAVLILTYSVIAWFTYQRKLADMQFVNAPGDLYITAGHGEALKYLDLKEVSVSNPDESCVYYVFGVRGSDAKGYNLQFSYTTNNQFEYFIYPAKECASFNESSTLVEYISHNDNGATSTKYYYEIDTSLINNTGLSYSGNASKSDYLIQNGSKIRGQTAPSAVVLSYMNIDENAVDARNGHVIMADNTKHDDTYNYSRSNVQDFAEPIYFQVNYIKSGMDIRKKVLDYYILEVSWKKLKDSGVNLYDDRETDILYISVEATEVN